MGYVEHYFENLIFGTSTAAEHDVNKKLMSNAEIETVERCYRYLAYVLFCGEDELKAFAEEI